MTFFEKIKDILLNYLLTTATTVTKAVNIIVPTDRKIRFLVQNKAEPISFLVFDYTKI